ncbi:MAG: PAS domain S-box protein [bacterium]|nr:PAS domain S-box protein [bacterium]
MSTEPEELQVFSLGKEFDAPLVLYRARVVRLISFIGVIILFYFGYENLLVGDEFWGRLEFLAGFVAILSLLLSYYPKWQKLSEYVLSSVVSAVAIVVFIDGGIGNAGFLWFFILPPAIFVFFGFKRGLIWEILFLSIVGYIVGLHYFGTSFLVYDLVLMRQFLISFVVFLLIISYIQFEKELVAESHRRSENAFRELIASVPSILYAFLETDPYAAIEVTANIFRILGYKRSAVVGVKGFWVEHIHPADKQKYLDAIKQAPIDEIKTLDYRFLKEEGSYVWLRDSFRVEKIKGILARVGTLEDISAVVGARVESTKFKQVLDSSPDHTVVTDTNGYILYANPAAETNTGYSIQEILGNRPSLWGRQMSAEFYRDMWRTIKIEQRPFVGVILNKQKNGTLYTAHTTIIPVLGESGNVEYFAGIERDITEEQKREENIGALERKLELTLSRLQESEESSRNVTASTTTGYYTKIVTSGTLSADIVPEVTVTASAISTTP